MVGYPQHIFMKLKKIKESMPTTLILRLGVLFAIIFYFATFSFWTAVLFTFLTACVFVIYRFFFTELGKNALDQIRMTVEVEKLKSQIKKKII
jgi:MFS superfamily sulfate permease-like transporter